MKLGVSNNWAIMSFIINETVKIDFVCMCAHVCVSRSKSLNLGHEIHRDAFKNKGDMLWETECVLKFHGLPETRIAW